MIVDFHVHSTASDGTFRPAELAEKAVRGGFAALAKAEPERIVTIDANGSVDEVWKQIWNSMTRIR